VYGLLVRALTFEGNYSGHKAGLSHFQKTKCGKTAETLQLKRRAKKEENKIRLHTDIQIYIQNRVGGEH
jgi:hypothetical protein